jgi:hypothetical protein
MNYTDFLFRVSPTISGVSNSTIGCGRAFLLLPASRGSMIEDAFGAEAGPMHHPEPTPP